MQSIDLNSDLGESFGRYSLGNDDQIIKLVSSVNVACGFHAGDPDVMAQTVAKAQAAGTAIGAHPSYPDRQGFGRRFMAMTADEVKHLVIYQIGALKAFTKNGRLHHVKPHGALYNRAAKDHELALAICQGIQAVDPKLPIYGLAGSQLIKAAQEIGLPFAQEAFADRNYEADGSLVARSHENAVITDPDLIAKRVLKLIQTQTLETIDGSILNLKADSICVHGDNKAALEIVEKIRSVLSEANIEFK
ncbi:MAG: 5-oxoprolinase subunit PxpA, partial [Oenococcus sp.]|uniref:LamB/YcsF family protein n=1 Tax=Oenococcus sp. TaxID=1979414 RepID=UPI0039EC2723